MKWFDRFLAVLVWGGLTASIVITLLALWFDIWEQVIRGIGNVAIYTLLVFTLRELQKEER